MSSERNIGEPPAGAPGAPAAARRNGDTAVGIPESVLANVGHELRTPMNSILGFADLLMEMDLTEEQLSYVKLLRQSGSQLLSMINNILDYSKAAASRIEIDAIAFDLRVLVEDAAYTLAIQAEQKGIELLCHIESDVPAQVVADPQYLRQILNNLAGNAIKFTSEGEVVIEVRLQSAAGKGPGRAVIEVSVTDTGIGIPPERLAPIFERFVQADPAIARQFGGTGLGLTITKQLVELMGGEIRVSSTPGVGSQFRFTLPVALPAEAGAPARADRRDITGLRILLVDANPTYRRILIKMLMNFGCSPVAVDSGRTALEALEQRGTGAQGVDLLIMDLTLPDMDGISLLAAIAQRPALKSLRVMVLTSMSQRRQARQLAALGCRGYLTKPVREAVLYDVIRDVMGNGNGGAERPLVTRYSVAERKFKGVRVLLAEDNFISAQVARKVLTHGGYSVVTAADGEKAVRAVEREDFGVVLMDVQMPRVDGLSATRRIRAAETAVGAERLPIIGLTASRRKADCDACLAAGMDAVAFKPIQPEQLNELVAGVLSRRSAGGCGPASVEPPPPPIDGDQALARTLGDRRFLKELVDVFLGSLADQTKALTAALSAGRMETATTIAHKLKGSAGNLCVTGVCEIAGKMEIAAREGRGAEARRLLEALDAETERLKAFVADDDWIGRGA